MSAEEVKELQKRVNRLENIVWVTLALALAFGLGGASLWTKLQGAQEGADQLQTQLGNIEERLNSGFPKLVVDAQATLDEHATQLASQITVREGRLGIATDNPQSRLHVAYGSGYIQIPHISGSMPPGSDCNEKNEAGRMIVHDKGIAICPQGATGWAKVN